MSTPAPTVPAVTLSDDNVIPQLGFGVFQIPAAETVQAVVTAFDAGYRHIDTASAYGNEAEVGQAVHAAGLQRGDVFITTKCFNNDHGQDKAKRALKTSLSKLEMDYVDLYLIHWPVPAHDKYVETWQAFIELQQEGLVRSIGVSNFNQPHLERIISETGVAPVVNQIELHPHFQQPGLRREHADLNIVTEAWSPLGQGAVLDDPVITEIAKAHGKTPGQVVLRWHIQLDNVVFPKSVSPSRVTENFQIFDFALTDEEMAAIEALDTGQRMFWDPDEMVMP